MTHRPRHRRFAAALAILLLLIGACSDDDNGSSDPGTTEPVESTEANGDDPDEDSDSDGTTGDTTPDEHLTGNPMADDVAVDITGAVEQTFRGGVCMVDNGFLQINAGFATGIGPSRPQGSPYANGTAQLIVGAEEGEHSSGTILNVVRESDGEFILAETPTMTVDPGLTSGTFESELVSGSWSCPGVLTAEQYQDLVEDLAPE